MKRGEMRAGVRRAYGYTWYCGDCGDEGPAEVSVRWDQESMEHCRQLAEHFYAEHRKKFCEARHPEEGRA